MISTMKFFLALCASLAVVLSTAQTANPDHAAQCDAIMKKVERLDMLNLILPLLLEKDQIKKLLPAIEKARQNVRIAQQKEYEELKKLEPELDKMLSEAENKDEIPKREYILNAYSTIRRLYTARRLIADGNTQIVLEEFKKVANKGQQKTAAGSLTAAQIGFNGKPEELTDDIRLEAFVREVLLHPSVYEILRKLSVRN